MYVTYSMSVNGIAGILRVGFSERHLTIFDEVSQLAEIIVNEGDLNKIDKMYQIRFINFEGESW